MTRLSAADLFVVTSPHTDSYSFEDEADRAAAEMNEFIKTLPFYRDGKHGYFVESLSDRVDTTECRNEGRHGSDR